MDTVACNEQLKAAAFTVEPGADRLGAPLFVVGDDVWIKISSRDTAGAFAVMEGSTHPRGGPPLHLHRNQDEWFYIPEGQYLFEVDGREIHADPGATPGEAS